MGVEMTVLTEEACRSAMTGVSGVVITDAHICISSEDQTSASCNVSVISFIFDSAYILKVKGHCPLLCHTLRLFRNATLQHGNLSYISQTKVLKPHNKAITTPNVFFTCVA